MIIGVLGLKGSGKDTIGNYLIENYKFKKLAYADSLKDAICCIFGWDREMMEGITKESREWREEVDPYWGVSPRHMMQKIGTDLFRKHISDDIWIKSLKLKLKKMDCDIVITDCRFDNEIDLIKELGGKVILVERNFPMWKVITSSYRNGIISKSRAESELIKTGIHETEWRCYLYDNIDYFIDNSGEIEELYLNIEKIISKV
jgi:hypothetical protein